MILSPIKAQPDVNYTQDIMAYTSETFQSVHIYSTKLKKTQYGFFTQFFFALTIIIIFCGLLLNRVSRLLIVNIKWLGVPIVDFSKKRCRNKRYNPKSSKPSCNARNTPPKGRNKNRPFSYYKFLKGRIFHILSSRVESSESIGFDSFGCKVIVNNS